MFVGHMHTVHTEIVHYWASLCSYSVGRIYVEYDRENNGIIICAFLVPGKFNWTVIMPLL